MGNPLFGVDISGLINTYIGSGVLAATLRRFTSGTRTAGQLTGGTNPTSVDFACRGFIDRKAKKNQRGSLTDDGTETIVLIGDSIDGGAASSAPRVDDRIVIESRTYVIKSLDRDPAAATYTCVCEAT